MNRLKPEEGDRVLAAGKIGHVIDIKFSWVRLMRAYTVRLSSGQIYKFRRDEIKRI